MKNRSVIRAFLFALLFTLISPITSVTSSQAAGTITKTVTVKGHDGALLSGASVLIWWYGTETETLYSGTTSAQGVAAITVPAGSVYMELAVAPAEADTQNAILSPDSRPDIFYDEDQSLEINLTRSNARFILKYANGTNVEKGIKFKFPANQKGSRGVMLARSGAFGVTLASNLTPGANYDVGPAVVESNIYVNKALFGWSYGFRAAGAAGSQTYKVFTDRTFSTEISPESSGIFSLTIPEANIVGQLKNVDGTNASLPTGVTGTVKIVKLNSNMTVDTSSATANVGASSDHIIYPDGSFPGRVIGRLAGTYRVIVSINGTSTIPSFGSLIYQDLNGKFSTTSGSFLEPTATASAPFTLNMTVPANPTIKIKSLLPGTSTPDSLTSMSFGNTPAFDENGNRIGDVIYLYPNGEASYVLPNGTHTFKVWSSSTSENGQNKTNDYTVVVSGSPSAVTSVTVGGTPVIAEGGFYNFVGRTPNLKINLVDSSTGASINDFFIQMNLPTVGKIQGDYIGGAGSRDGLSRIIVDEGAYVLRVHPNTSGYTSQEFQLTVDSSMQPTITGVSAVGGVFTLRMTQPNAKLQFKINGVISTRGFIEFCQGADEYNIESCTGEGFDQEGKVYANLQPGSYFIRTNPLSSTLATKTYSATVDSNRVLSITGATKSSDGFWQVTGQTPNAKFKVTNPISGGLITSAYIGFQKIDSDGDYLYSLPGSELNSNEPGLASSFIPDGNYVLVVNPGNDASVSGLAAKRYVMSVVGGVSTISSGGQTVAKDGDFWLLTLANANLNLKLKTPSGGVLTASWFDVCQDTGNGPSRTGSCNGQGTNELGEDSLNVEPGNYYIRVNPGSGSLFAQKIYAMTVASDGTVTITGAGSSKVGDYWLLQAAAPNFSGAILKPNGETITVPSRAGFDLQLQKWNTVKGFWEYVVGQWRNTSDFAFTLAGGSAKEKYRLTVNPRGLPSYTNTSSLPFWVNTNGKLAITENGTFEDELSNFNITLKVPNVLIDFIDPDGVPLQRGWITAFSVDPSNNRQDWIGNGDISSDNPGKVGFNFADGTYRLEANPSSGGGGMTRKQYKVVVSGNGATVVVTGWTNTTAVAKNGDRFVITAGKANITGRVTASDGTPLGNVSNAYTNINVQTLNANGNWDWTSNWYSTDGDGYFNINVEDPGTYRLRVEPSGRTNVTVTVSDQFVITNQNAGTFRLDINPLKLNAPDLLLSVYQGETATALNNIGIEVRKNDQWIDWASTSQSGVAGISFADAGSYQLIVNPNPEQTQSGATRATYDVVVTKDSAGVKTATVTVKTGVTKVGNLNKLKLGTAALSGFVRLPASGANAVVANANVVAIDANGKELWQYASNTSATGKWAISLPAGTYSLQARAPYGSGTYGNSEKVGTVTIASNGSATLTGALLGQDPLALGLTLKDPTWSGTILAPGSSTDPIANAQVCLVIQREWNCSQSNQNGEWALSAPTGFDAFDASAEFRIEDVQKRLYPSLIIRGATEVSTALGGLTSNGRTYRLPSANVSITVTAGGAAASGIWVNLEEVNVGWLGSNMSDATGVAKFYVDPSKLSVPLRARAEINGNPKYSTDYASSSASITGTGSAITATLPLSVPNLKAILSEPTIGGVAGAAVPYSWVELLRENGLGWDEWVSGTNTDSQGQFAFFAPALNGAETKYIIRVRPPWNGSSTSTERDYLVTVNSGGSVSSIVVRNNISVAMSQAKIDGIDYWKLTLAAPTLTGTVLDSAGQPIANSYINPFNQITYAWMSGVNSRNNGSFSMALNDGTYRLEANVPWGVTNTARSAQCSVTLLNGAVTTGGTCVQPDKSVQLRLRAPNVTFTLKSDGVAIPYANVGMGYGSWNTWAQSDSTGKVSLFIDPQAIATANPNATGQVAPYMWIDPPWNGGNKMVRWDCALGSSKPICSGLPLVTIGGTYPQSDLGDIEVLKPNTVLEIKVPGSATSIGAGAWVNIVSYGLNGANQTWAGANTDASGQAHFYLDTSTATADTRWGVTVNPPWDKRQQYSVKEFGTYQENGNWTSGLTWAQLMSTTFEPAVPNFTITVNRPTGSANRYGWVQLEEVNESGTVISWKNGTSLDYSGRSSLLLAAGKNYRLTAYPNGGDGARTMCSISTSSAPITFARITDKCAAGTLNGSALSLILDQGNVTGTVNNSSAQPVFGAIVAAVSGETVLTTTTNESGRFGLDLDFSGGKTWAITIIPQGDTLANKTLTTQISAAGEITPAIVLANR